MGIRKSTWKVLLAVLVVIALVYVYVGYRHKIVINAARDSLKYINDFHSSHGYYPCEEDFYNNFFTNKYPNLKKASNNPPSVSYSAVCQTGKDHPLTFGYFCYSVGGHSMFAFGESKDDTDGFGGNVSSYCVDPNNYQKYLK